MGWKNIFYKSKEKIMFLNYVRVELKCEREDIVNKNDLM